MIMLKDDLMRNAKLKVAVAENKTLSNNQRANNSARFVLSILFTADSLADITKRNFNM